MLSRSLEKLEHLAAADCSFDGDYKSSFIGWFTFCMMFFCLFVLTYLFTPVNVFEVQVSLRSAGNMQRSLNKQESLRNTIAVGHFVKNTV